MLRLLSKSDFKVDDIISYAQLVAAEGQQIQRGMNFNINPQYSIFLMSLRHNAPYADVWDEKTNTLIYEGHDKYQNHTINNPKEEDQPLVTPKGALTENGKFFSAAQAYRLGLIKVAHRIKVYEKIKDGIWCYKGFFTLVDAKIENTGSRNVFKFYLQPVEPKTLQKDFVIPHNRIIPTEVKLQVWKRDQGKCIRCGSDKNLHFDHDLPFSKGGTSLNEKNVRILCMKCNLSKSNKIMTVPPFLS